MPPPDASPLAPGSVDAAAAPSGPRAPLTFREACVLSLAWGYAALLVLGCLAVALDWAGLRDTLDVRSLFR